MGHSLVFDRFFFLRDLGVETNERLRITMIQYMNVHMMEAFAKVVEYIVLGTFPIRRGDYREFRQYLDVLFQVVNPHVSLTTKRETLIRYNQLIPRLMRERYLQRTITAELNENRVPDVAPAA